MLQKPDNNYQICSNCVLDTSVPNIFFDEKGICNFCHQFFHKKPLNVLSPEKQKAKLIEVTEMIQAGGKGKPYDCILGLSGGVDSSYVAWLVKKAGLRPLAVHFDNGWNSEIAVANIEKICKKLDIELYTYVVDWEEFRDLQLSFLKAGVANAEMPTDHAIFATLYMLATKFNVNYIMDGTNNATEFVRDGFYAGGWSYSDLRHLKAIHKKFGTVPLKTFPMMSLYKKAWLQKVRGVLQIPILNYVNYNKADAIEVLKNELNWKSYGGKHHENLFTKWHQVVYLPTRFHFDKRSAHLSDLILSGQISRAEAIDELRQPPISEEEKRLLESYVMKKLNLSQQDYLKIINSPSIQHDIYPSSKRMMDLYKRLKTFSVTNPIGQ